MFLADKYDAPSLKDFLFPPGYNPTADIGPDTLIEYRTAYSTPDSDEAVYTFADSGRTYVCMVQNGFRAITDSCHVTQFKCVD